MGVILLIKHPQLAAAAAASVVYTKIYRGLPGGESIFFLLFSVGVHLNFNKI